MSHLGQPEERRVSARIEVILEGWWKLGEGRFQRCKTLDVSLDGALIVLDSTIEDGTKFALHLDVEADWSMPLEAKILWQRPIFFGKQQLTSVTYRFLKTADRSMFGLWLQRKMSETEGPKAVHTNPVVLSAPKPDVHPSLGPAPQISRVESKWRQTLSHLTAKIPWIEAEPVPQERRVESRGQVGLKVRLEWEGETWDAEFLNVGLSGAGMFVPISPDLEKRWAPLAPGVSLDICLPESQILLGGSRCPAQIVWSYKAELKDQESRSGLAVGVRFLSKPPVTRRTFIGDLLKRIDYNVRQVRSELRFPREIPVFLVLPDGDRVEGYTTDISAGGASINLPVELPTPYDIALHLDLGEGSGRVHFVKLSSRLLRRVVDKDGRTCYAVAFRKGQGGEYLELSRWLASLLPVQGLRELIPNFSKVRMGEIE